ncbi:GNAT family N-acetyltransferase [Roseibium denhamense]|uniref:Acetyltransferase (GNAT) family protein n=1 Tax=Roseibium denhamense TaxID=76305 RepID=A0ABY1NR81_9HYPH|nr:GNAT family N-acetyltransferase [Roseibium denhamense]MTI08047.1 GNAT family N-acetyltransferase [Roseibium denhamense]SMP15926.1 Acetyltransferase (GNAT) family protein [Roseibium denhamense]
MTSKLKIRPLEQHEMKVPMDMAGEEGWNPGLEDGAAFFAADSKGFFCGEIDGKLINVISAVKYEDSFGFIGLYICKPEFRQQGFGHVIWDHAMGYLGNRLIGLDAVLEQTASYAEHGFRSVYRNIRNAGISQWDTPMDPRIAPLGHGIFPSVVDYDRRFFPAGRTQFLRQWCAPMLETRRGFAFVDDGEFRGYGVLRKCLEGYKIGPLFADTPEIADILFQALAGQVKGDPIILDTPEPNAAALLLAEQYELSPEFETFRMYRGLAPELPLDQMFGITTFELG